MKEQEAKTKWCPQARATDGTEPGVSINRTHNGVPDRDCLCLGSSCMAWRWASQIVEDGYCGIAGKP